MAAGSRSRFEAQKVLRLIALHDGGQMEMHFCNARGTRHIVSLPLPVAVALGRLICDLAEGAPFLIPDAGREKPKKSVKRL